MYRKSAQKLLQTSGSVRNYFKARYRAGHINEQSDDASTKRNALIADHIHFRCATVATSAAEGVEAANEPLPVACA